ncbi:MAG: division/cell wall cluster transcriptional repressor MraZ [Solirubrobacterales bacterium]
MAFLGSYEHTLDKKDRLTIPSRFRGELEGELIVHVGIEPCLSVYTAEAFDAFFANYLGNLDPFALEARDMQRIILGNAYNEQLDSAGRLRIHNRLKEYANLASDSKCAVVGVHNHLEIWDGPTWDARMAEQLPKIDATAHQLRARGD